MLVTPPCSANWLKKGFSKRSKKGRFEVVFQMGGRFEVAKILPEFWMYCQDQRPSFGRSPRTSAQPLGATRRPVANLWVH